MDKWLVIARTRNYTRGHNFFSATFLLSCVPSGFIRKEPTLVFSRRAWVMSYSTSSISALQAKQGKAFVTPGRAPAPSPRPAAESRARGPRGWDGSPPPVTSAQAETRRTFQDSQTEASFAYPLAPVFFINHIRFTFSCKTHVVFFLKNRETSAPSPSEYPKPHWVTVMTPTEPQQRKHFVQNGAPLPKTLFGGV